MSFINKHILMLISYQIKETIEQTTLKYDKYMIVMLDLSDKRNQL